MRTIRRTLAVLPAACMLLLSLSACTGRKIQISESSTAEQSGTGIQEPSDSTTGTTAPADTTTRSRSTGLLGRDDPDREYPMPSLIGMDFQEAQLLYGESIEIQIISSEFSSYEKGTIFDQDIKPNDPVKKGQRVNVKVSLGARRVTIQDMTGWDYETAKNQILTLGLQVDPRTAYDAEVEEGKVIRTNPPGPCELTPGDYVQVVVSRGRQAAGVIVPTFIGMQWDLARTMAEGNHLVVGKEDVNDSAPEGTVLAQSVSPGEEITEGTPIMLKVSTGKTRGQSISVTFTIPASAKGTFRIVLYEDGKEKASSSQFKPEYALGSTRLTVSGTGTHDMIAMLFNEATGSEARIGTYRIDFDDGTYTPLSADIMGAFERVGGLS